MPSSGTPRKMLLDPSTNRLYVTCMPGVDVYDTTTNTKISTLDFTLFPISASGGDAIMLGLGGSLAVGDQHGHIVIFGGRLPTPGFIVGLFTLSADVAVKYLVPSLDLSKYFAFLAGPIAWTDSSGS